VICREAVKELSPGACRIYREAVTNLSPGWSEAQPWVAGKKRSALKERKIRGFVPERNRPVVWEQLPPIFRSFRAIHPCVVYPGFRCAPPWAELLNRFAVNY
jgi:hypothetical protein